MQSGQPGPIRSISPTACSMCCYRALLQQLTAQECCSHVAHFYLCIGLSAARCTTAGSIHLQGLAPGMACYVCHCSAVGPVCIVTGGSRGIGRAIALALGKEGARVRRVSESSGMHMAGCKSTARQHLCEEQLQYSHNR
jgi:hypothetical protein